MISSLLALVISFASAQSGPEHWSIKYKTYKEERALGPQDGTYDYNYTCASSQKYFSPSTCEVNQYADNSSGTYTEIFSDKGMTVEYKSVETTYGGHTFGVRKYEFLDDMTLKMVNNRTTVFKKDGAYVSENKIIEKVTKLQDGEPTIISYKVNGEDKTYQIKEEVISFDPFDTFFTIVTTFTDSKGGSENSKKLQDTEACNYKRKGVTLEEAAGQYLQGTWANKLSEDGYAQYIFAAKSKVQVIDRQGRSLQGTYQFKKGVLELTIDGASTVSLQFWYGGSSNFSLNRIVDRGHRDPHAFLERKL